MRDKDLLKLLQKNGWRIARIKGSYQALQKENKIMVVPLHGKDVPIGLFFKRDMAKIALSLLVIWRYDNVISISRYLSQGRASLLGRIS